MVCSPHLCGRLVGGLGIGPKYLVDEYAILDARYWVLSDSLVAWVCYQEFFIMMPLELIWYIALQRKHWSRHYWAIVTGKYIYTPMCHAPITMCHRNIPVDGDCVLHWC